MIKRDISYISEFSITVKRLFVGIGKGVEDGMESIFVEIKEIKSSLDEFQCYK